MGFIDAVFQIGEVDSVDASPIEQYVSFPLDVNKEGRVIQVLLDFEDIRAEALNVRGVSEVRLVHFQTDPQMKMKYMWRKRTGSRVSWGFTPIYKMGKPPAGEGKKREAFFGESGDWQKAPKCHLSRIKARVLQDYEDDGTFTKGSVDRIMRDLPGAMDEFMGQITDSKLSHIIIFGGIDHGQFVYPGDIPAMVDYFTKKLKQELGAEGAGAEADQSVRRRCAICGKVADTSTLDKVFAFSTHDKCSIFPGIDEDEAPNVFPVCTDCLGKIAAGRSRIERSLTNTSAIPGTQIWVVPESAGGDYGRYKMLLRNLEENLSKSKMGTPGAEVEQRYFQRLAEQGKGLIFHFVFWERNNSQELVHLMVEDVPPERLAYLENCWREAFFSVFENESSPHKVNLDSAVRSLYGMLTDLAGKSTSDKEVSREFVFQVMEHLLSGRRPPVEAFKQFVVSRIPRLFHETDDWRSVKTTVNYALAWVQFLNIISEGGGV